MCLWYTSALSPKPVHGSQWALHPGLSVLALVFPSPYPPQAPIVFRYCVDSDRPILASKALVCWSAGPSIRRAGNFSSSTTSYQPPSLSASSSRAPQASFSYLATLRRFARAAGFSSRFAAQVGLAWRSSSRAFSRLGDLCLTSGPGQHDLVRSFWIEAPARPFRPPAWDLSAVLQFFNSSNFAPLHRVSSSFDEEGPVFCGLGHCQTGWWGAGCLWDGVFCSSRRLSLLCARVCHQDGVLFLFPSSLFLGGFLVGFCGWAGRWTAAVPVRALRLSSDLDFLLFSPLPRLFSVPGMPFSGFVEDSCFFLPTGGILGTGAARSEVGSVGAHRDWGVSTLAAFHVTW